MRQSLTDEQKKINRIARNKSQYLKNKNKTKICECGREISIYHIKDCIKSKIHKSNMKEKELLNKINLMEILISSSIESHDCSNECFISSH